mgnify:CR=1 FL=1
MGPRLLQRFIASAVDDDDKASASAQVRCLQALKFVFPGQIPENEADAASRSRHDLAINLDPDGGQVFLREARIDEALEKTGLPHGKRSDQTHLSLKHDYDLSYAL